MIAPCDVHKHVQGGASPWPFRLKAFWLKWLSCCFTATTALRFFLTLFSLVAPMLAQRLSQQTTQQTSFIHDQTQCTTSRLEHKRRPSPTQGLIALTVLIATCALPLASAPALVSQAPACLPPLAHLLCLSCVRCPLVRMSSWKFEPTTLPACKPGCRNKSPISSPSQPPQQSRSIEIYKTLADLRADISRPTVSISVLCRDKKCQL